MIFSDVSRRKGQRPRGQQPQRSSGARSLPVLGFLPVTALSDFHESDRFHCGKPALDRWLKRYALPNQQLDSSKTFVTAPVKEPRRVAGYYSLTVASVQHEAAPPSVEEGMPGYPIPVMLLARLAVDQAFRRPNMNARLGEALLRDALLRTVSVAENVGIRAVMVDAIDDDAVRFYGRYGFEPSPIADFQLFLQMSRIRASLAAATE